MTEREACWIVSCCPNTLEIAPTPKWENKGPEKPHDTTIQLVPNVYLPSSCQGGQDQVA